MTGEGATCPYCQEPRRERAERGGLMVVSEPWRVFWQGKELRRPSPMATRFLFLLLRSATGQVPLSSMELFLRDSSGPKSVTTHIHGLRQWLEARGLPFIIQSLHGWGYQLQQIAS